jgi:hypothetical protein
MSAMNSFHVMRASFRQSETEIKLKASEDSAKLLVKVGMPVSVRKYRGGQASTRTASLPRRLSHGLWVVYLTGFEGEYDCGRVSPLEQKTGELRLESEAA